MGKSKSTTMPVDALVPYITRAPIQYKDVILPV